MSLHARRTTDPNSHIQVGDHQVNCHRLYKQLGEEVSDLDRRISVLQQSCQPDLDQLNHLGKILKSRQAILSWLEVRDVIHQG